MGLPGISYHSWVQIKIHGLHLTPLMGGVVVAKVPGEDRELGGTHWWVGPLPPTCPSTTHQCTDLHLWAVGTNELFNTPTLSPKSERSVMRSGVKEKG